MRSEEHLCSLLNHIGAEAVVQCRPLLSDAQSGESPQRVLSPSPDTSKVSMPYGTERHSFLFYFLLILADRK
jgi:hypothetical protein